MSRTSQSFLDNNNWPNSAPILVSWRLRVPTWSFHRMAILSFFHDAFIFVITMATKQWIVVNLELGFVELVILSSLIVQRCHFACQKCYLRQMERWWRSRIVRCMDNFHKIHCTKWKTTRWIYMVREEKVMISGPFQAISFTVITWKPESNCTCRLKVANLETIIDMQSWCRTWPPNGSRRTRAKQKLLRKHKGARKSSWNPKRKPKVIYTDNSLEFGKACEDLSWNHCTSTPHRSETNGIAERAECAE